MNQKIIDKLKETHSLEMAEWEQLISSYTKDDLEYAMNLAQEIAVKEYGKTILSALVASVLCNLLIKLL